MISFIARMSPLSVAAGHLLKSEALSVLLCASFQRTVCTKKYFVLDPQRNSYTLCIKNYRNAANAPKKFGKVVELDEETWRRKFEMVDEQSKQERKNGNKTEAPALSDADKEEKKISQSDEKEKHSMGTNTYGSKRENSGLLRSVVLKLKTRKMKERNKEIILEGKRLIHEALLAGLNPHKIFFCRFSDLQDLRLPEGTETYRISYKCARLWSNVVTPQGIVGIFEMPDENTINVKQDDVPLIVICDNVKDPGNLGAILRVTAGVGCEKLILTTGCTCVWEQKVLRAAAGAHFRFPIFTNCTWGKIKGLISQDSKVFILDGRKKLVKGEKNSEENIAFRKYYEISEDIPVSFYYSVAFEKKSSVIIIGGESDGLSREAYEFTLKRNGIRVCIPVANKIESLNNAVALGVLAFEFKRQLQSIAQKDVSSSCS